VRAVRLALVTLALLAQVIPATAHEGHLHWWEVGTTWTWDPWVVLPIALAGALYTAGVTNLWRAAGRDRGLRLWQAACFAAGWVCLVGALIAPLHWLGERLFWAHMVEHELLMTIAAPLLILGRPAIAAVWALPASWRPVTGGMMAAATRSRLWRWITTPSVATVLHAVALWIWHAPFLFEAALAHPGIHWLQRLSFLLTALVFWWALLLRGPGQAGCGAAVLYLLITSIHTGLLGVLFAMASRSIYPAQTLAAENWGLLPIEDQQLAGLIMWVPAGLVYAAAALALAGLAIFRTGKAYS